MSANGVCLQNIINAFEHSEFEVHVMARRDRNETREEIINGVHVHRYNGSFYYKMLRYSQSYPKTTTGKLAFFLTRLMGIRMVLFLPFYPMRDPFLVNRCGRKAIQLHRKMNFDMIIGTYNPLESVLALTKIKKQFPNRVKTCSYFLDTLSNETPHRFLSKEFINKQGRKYEKNIFEHSDLVLNMLYHENHFKSSVYDEYCGKMKFVDLPVLKQREKTINSENIEKHQTNAVYTGIVRVDTFSYIISVFEKTENITFHVYSSSQLSGFNSDILIKHGQVSYEEAITAQNNSDVLISMGNKDSDYVPSKIFEYMSTGKKIIHFCYGDNDSCIRYYKKYNNALIIDVNDETEKNALKINEFINNDTDIIPFSQLKEIFKDNLPEETVAILKNLTEEQ